MQSITCDPLFERYAKPHDVSDEARDYSGRWTRIEDQGLYHISPNPGLSEAKPQEAIDPTGQPFFEHGPKVYLAQGKNRAAYWADRIWAEKGHQGDAYVYRATHAEKPIENMNEAQHATEGKVKVSLVGKIPREAMKQHGIAQWNKRDIPPFAEWAEQQGYLNWE